MWKLSVAVNTIWKFPVSSAAGFYQFSKLRVKKKLNMGYTFRNLTLILKMMVWTRWLFLRWRIIMISSGMVSWLGITAGKRTRPTRPLLSLLVEIGSLVQVKSWQQTLMFARLIGGGFFGCKEFDNLEIYIYIYESYNMIWIGFWIFCKLGPDMVRWYA